MPKFTSKSEIPSNLAPLPPKECMHCGKPADVVNLTVLDDRGVPHTGIATEFGEKKANGVDLRGRYTFANWKSECADCHTTPKNDWKNQLLREHWKKTGIRVRDNPNLREDCLKKIRDLNPALAARLVNMRKMKGV